MATEDHASTWVPTASPSPQTLTHPPVHAFTLQTSPGICVVCSACEATEEPEPVFWGPPACGTSQPAVNRCEGGVYEALGEGHRQATEGGGWGWLHPSASTAGRRSHRSRAGTCSFNDLPSPPSIRPTARLCGRPLSRPTAVPGPSHLGREWRLARAGGRGWEPPSPCCAPSGSIAVTTGRSPLLSPGEDTPRRPTQLGTGVRGGGGEGIPRPCPSLPEVTR